MSGPDPRGRGRRFSRDMTVAHIRERRGAAVDVVFLESARIYKLRRDQRSFNRILRELRNALSAKRVLKVTLPSVDSDMIEDVQRPREQQ